MNSFTNEKMAGHEISRQVLWQKRYYSFLSTLKSRNRKTVKREKLSDKPHGHSPSIFSHGEKNTWRVSVFALRY